MSLKFVVSRFDNDTYEQYLGKSLKKLDTISYDVFDDPGEKLSLTKKYNLGIAEALKNDLKDNDIVIFAHEDLFLEDKSFAEKVELTFQEKTVGLCGVVGCCSFDPNSGMWWANKPENLFGHCIQEYRTGESNHLVKGTIGFTQSAICVDGLILMIRGKLLKDGLRFDEQFNLNFYDISICLDILIKTDFKVAIADILVKHKSEGLGSLSSAWQDERKLMLQKYKKIGLKFPIDSERIAQFKGTGLYDKKK